MSFSKEPGLQPEEFTMRIHLTLRTVASLVAVSATMYSMTASAAPRGKRAASSEGRESGDKGRKEGRGHLAVSPELEAKIKAAHQSVSKGAQPGLETQRAFAAELAAEVRAGKLDDAALEARLSGLKERAAQAGARQAEFLKALHASLTPAERKEFAEATRAQAQKMAAHQARKPKDAKAKPDADGQEGPEEHGPAAEHMRHRRGGPGGLVAALQLTPEQQNKLKDALETDRNGMQAQHEAMRVAHLARATALAASFEKSDFDPSKLPAVAVPANGGPAAHELKVVRALLPVLSVPQREVLATELLKDRHARRNHRHHGARG